MRTCPEVRGIAAHCVRLCRRNGKATAGLTELTINCNNNNVLVCVGYRHVHYFKKKTLTIKKHQRSQNNGFKFSYISPRLFLLESQSKQQQGFVTGKVKVCNPACLTPSS